MEQGGILLLLFAGLALAGLLVWYSHHQEQKRLEAFQLWARGRDWSYRPDKRKDPGYAYELFERGHSRWLRHLVWKEFEAPTPGLSAVKPALFEYHYAITRSTGKSTSTSHYYFSCLLVDPGLDLGAVELTREGLGDKLLQAIGFDDIDLEDPEFSRRYAVKARRREEAYALFDQAMMRFLTALEPPSLATNGRELLLFAETSASPAVYESMTRFALRFLAQLPRPLVNAERAARGLPPLVEAGNAAPGSRAALEHLEGDRT